MREGNHHGCHAWDGDKEEDEDAIIEIQDLGLRTLYLK